MKPPNPPADPPYHPAPPPAWARPDTTASPLNSSLEAGWCAGAMLAALHALVRAEPPFAGAWRHRLALHAATASVKLAGFRDDAATLRDAWLLRRPTDALSPAGAHLLAWRDLARDATDLSDAAVRRAAIGFGASPAVDLEPLLATTKAAERTHKNPLRRAAAVAAGAVTISPRHQFLGLWLADLVLARALRWTIPLPLIVTQLTADTAKQAAGGPAKTPAAEAFETRVGLAYARAASAALDLAGDLSRRAQNLTALAPKLRAKGAGSVVKSLLDDDAIAPAQKIGGMSDRGMRRLCERLVDHGGIRELTGRTTFRLYGL